MGRQEEEVKVKQRKEGALRLVVKPMTCSKQPLDSKNQSCCNIADARGPVEFRRRLMLKRPSGTALPEYWRSGPYQHKVGNFTRQGIPSCECDRAFVLLRPPPP